MQQLTLTFLAVVALVALLTTITAWSARSLRLRVAVAALGLIVLPLAYAVAMDLLGRARPVVFTAIADDDDATVLGSKSVEDEGIWLLVDAPGWDEPRHLVVPWSQQAAEALHEAQQRSQSEGTPVRMRLEPGPEDTEPMFYAEPQPALPEKLASSHPAPIVLPSN